MPSPRPQPSADFGHGISLLVHERVDVIVDQCLNFETFAPHSVIMLHVSGSAAFPKDNLIAALLQAGCSRCVVNPVSVPSEWGNVIAGHLANIRELAKYCAPDAAIAMNASNDLLLSQLPADEGRAGARYEEREVSRTGIWYTGRQFARSAAFADLLKRLDCTVPVGSQIEGSSYPLVLLTELVDRLEHDRELLAQLPQAAEEIVFPCWAFARLGPAPLRPFILFRPSPLTGLGARLIPPALRGGALPDYAQKAMNRIGAGLTSPNAGPADIAAIMAGHPVLAPGWPNGSADRIAQRYLGVKRIPRDYDHPLRQRIRQHTRAAASMEGQPR